MSNRPIIFSAPMVRAILDGRKTVTRRILKPQPNSGPNGEMVHLGDGSWGLSDGVLTGEWKLARPGDRLWVREAWRSTAIYDVLSPSEMNGKEPIRYECDETWQTWGWKLADKHGRLRPSIHMPRWASRITLEVTEVRVQRLQDISEEDAKAEGAPCCVTDGEGKFYCFDMPNRGTHKCGFAGLWSSIHGPGSWDANQWVAAITFKIANQEPTP